jgi:hypothetical protein
MFRKEVYMKEAQPRNICMDCPRPCDSLYNDDGECWKEPPKDIEKMAPVEKEVQEEED